MDPNQNNAHKRILVVEDEEFLRDLYVRILKGERYTVDQAKDGAEAFTALQEGGYDLVLLDIMLPILNGLDVLKKLSKVAPKKENKSILILTNLDEDIAVAEGISYGVKGYLLKNTTSTADLRQVVRKYV
ncbi:MAG: response regulator [Candidatus Roizmanbacteria bacterium]|nr:response regulator [Candidatus Roizmanbacteria bacterium]